MWCGFGDLRFRNRFRPEKKKNNKDSTEIRKTIKDSNVLESFEILISIRIVLKFEKQ